MTDAFIPSSHPPLNPLLLPELPWGSPVGHRTPAAAGRCRLREGGGQRENAELMEKKMTESVTVAASLANGATTTMTRHRS